MVTIQNGNNLNGNNRKMVKIQLRAGGGGKPTRRAGGGGKPTRRAGGGGKPKQQVRRRR